MMITNSISILLIFVELFGVSGSLSIIRGQHTFSIKGQIVNVFGFTAIVSFTTAQLCHCSVKALYAVYK